MRRKKEHHSCERTDLGSQVSAISWLPLIIDKRERGIGNGSRDATQFAYVT